MDVYAAVGESFQQVGGNCPEGWKKMDGERPGPKYVAGENGVWVQIDTPTGYQQLPVRDFLALFTREEKLAVKAATRVSDDVGLWYDEMLAAQFITAEDPDTVNGLQALVGADLLSPERQAEILAAMHSASRLA